MRTRGTATEDCSSRNCGQKWSSWWHAEWASNALSRRSQECSHAGSKRESWRGDCVVACGLERRRGIAAARRKTVCGHLQLSDVPAADLRSDDACTLACATRCTTVDVSVTDAGVWCAPRRARAVEETQPQGSCTGRTRAHCGRHHARLPGGRGHGGTKFRKIMILTCRRLRTTHSSKPSERRRATTAGAHRRSARSSMPRAHLAFRPTGERNV